MGLQIKRIAIDRKDHLFLSRKTFERLCLPKEKVYLNFGCMKKRVTLDILDNLEENVGAVPFDFMPDITIPENIEFEWYLKGDQMVFGPVIGIVMGNSLNQKTASRSVFLRRWLTDYSNLKGLIFAFPKSEIIKNKQTLNGFYYDPENKENRGWTDGTFPYPGAVFNRPFSKLGSRYKGLVEVMGDCCFNESEFEKWKFYTWITRNPITESLVPYTEKLTDIHQVTILLKLFQVVFLKRRYGGKGIGIFEIRKVNTEYEVTDTKNEKVVFLDSDKMEAFLQEKIKRKEYIVQQGVPVYVDGKKIDFRVYLQKDDMMRWKASGLIARVAKAGSIKTNIRFTEQINSGKEALQEFYGLDETEADLMIKKINRACLQVGNSLDQYGGHFGDIALDFVLEPQGNIYFLEANSAYGHKSLFLINDREIRNTIFKSPMAYAKALAGFPVALRE